MNLQDILGMINFVTDEDYVLESGNIPSKILAVLNACSGELVGPARYAVRATYSYTVASGTKELPLPNDLYALPKRAAVWFKDDPVKEVLLDDTVSTGYRRWGNVLILQDPPTEDGTYTLYYHAQLPRFTGDPTQVPSIPSQFHDLYWLYGAMRVLQNREDELVPKRDFHAEYETRKAELDAFTASHDTVPYIVTKQRSASKSDSDE